EVDLLEYAFHSCAQLDRGVGLGLSHKLAVDGNRPLSHFRDHYRGRRNGSSACLGISLPPAPGTQSQCCGGKRSPCQYIDISSQSIHRRLLLRAWFGLPRVLKMFGEREPRSRRLQLAGGRPGVKNCPFVITILREAAGCHGRPEKTTKSRLFPKQSLR